ncbi:MAG: N-acetylmuramoyl-L-alanine amidase, partial [Clostridia bacterium]|nr:N-acetylmuramoyl-L-alanine amidase [Clostridia bacterium]
MFIVKKSLIAALAFILVCSALIGTFAAVKAKEARFVNVNLPTVVIDAGHGGIDAGVVGVETKEKESNINLAIAKYLRGYFINAGFNCVLTRAAQGGLYNTTAKGFKMRDMLKRKQIIEGCNADMVISVHQNFCPIPSRRGGTAFYDKDRENGKTL